MLINDLLNILFDQSNYEALITLASLHKRKTTYANKYSVLRYYLSFNHILTICSTGKIKALKHIADGINFHIGAYIDGEFVYDGNSALWCASSDGNVLMVKYLVSIGADINVCYSHALLLSAANGHIQMVKYLVSIGSDPHYFGQVVDNVAYCGHLGILKYFVSIGVHCEDGNALSISAENGHLEMVKYLVSIGADVNAQDGCALYWSELNGHTHVVDYLMSVGAIGDDYE